MIGSSICAVELSEEYKYQTTVKADSPDIHTIVGEFPRQGPTQPTVTEAADASRRQSMSSNCSSMHTPQHTQPTCNRLEFMYIYNYNECQLQ